MSNYYKGKLSLSVTEIKVSSVLSVVGTLNTLQDLPAESHIVDLVHSNGTTEGRFSIINRDNLMGQFTSRAKSSLELEVGKTYLILDSYWGERVNLILNPDYIWKATYFQTSESIIIPATDGFIMTQPNMTTGTSKYEKGIWTHEHCAICWATIDERRNKAYSCEQGYWVCSRCYEDYISKRNIQIW